MAESPDFHQVMKKRFGLEELGLWFTQPRTSRSGEFSKTKFTLHIEHGIQINVLYISQ